jgi:hypothetical protein
MGRQTATFLAACTRHGFAKVAFAPKPDRKREVNEAYRVLRFIFKAHQNAFA